MTISSLHLSLAGGAAWWRELREFFAYHGPWALGVRVLRKLSVRDKVLLVLGVTAAPMLPLAWFLVSQQAEIVASTTQRLAAVRLVDAISSLAVSVNNDAVGREGGPSAPLTGSGPAQLAALARAIDVAIDAGLPARQAWERNRPLLERAVQTSQRSDAGQFELDGQALQALVDLQAASTEAVTVAATTDIDLHDSARLTFDDFPTLQIAMIRVQRAAKQMLAGAATATERERHEWQLQIAAANEGSLHAAEQASQRLHALHRDRADTEQVLPAVRAFQDLVRKQLLADGPPADTGALASSFLAARKEVLRLRQERLDEVERVLDRQLADARRMRGWVTGALLTGILVSAYLLYSFFLVIRGGLLQLNRQMTLMAQGDLSARPLPLGEDEVALTMHAMSTALVRLSDLLASVQHGVAAVNQASQQVARGNGELSGRTQESAHGLAAVVDGVARSAGQLQACGRQVEVVVSHVQALRLEAARNRKQMLRLHERMNSLRGKSREIGEIVTLIDHIAFRTNILALNASVEASKAGEAGRGFAVVAQEVRSLAQRGAESARRIAVIVARSSDDIEQSNALASETGRALAAADAHVDQIHVAMDDVAALTRSGELESAGILQQLTQLKASTGQNVRLVGQLATASDALRTLGERLKNQVGQFKLS